MLTIIWFICVNLVDQKWTLLTNEFKWKIQNGHEIHLYMNKKQNDYQNPNWTSFFICGLKLLNLFILYDLGAEKKHFWCLLSNIVIVKSKIDAILHIYY